MSCPKCTPGATGELCAKHEVGDFARAPAADGFIPGSIAALFRQEEPATLGPPKALVCARCGADRTEEIAGAVAGGAKAGARFAKHGLGLAAVGQQLGGIVGALMLGATATSAVMGRLCTSCAKTWCPHGVKKQDGNFCKPCIEGFGWPYAYVVGPTCAHGIDLRFDCRTCGRVT